MTQVAPQYDAHLFWRRCHPGLDTTKSRDLEDVIRELHDENATIAKI
jgi:hypothetical protein